MFEELTGVQLTALHSLFEEEIDRNRHEAGRVTPEDDQAISEMMTGVREQAVKRRRLPGGYEMFWWAR